MTMKKKITQKPKKRRVNPQVKSVKDFIIGKFYILKTRNRFMPFQIVGIKDNELIFRYTDDSKIYQVPVSIFKEYTGPFDTAIELNEHYKLNRELQRILGLQPTPFFNLESPKFKINPSKNSKRRKNNPIYITDKNALELMTQIEGLVERRTKNKTK